jgi:GxxExxY protein
LLESTYLHCLNYELTEEGLRTQPQLALPLTYKDIHMECGYRIDMLVEGKVIVEVKSVETLKDVHIAQLLTYLKLTNIKIGQLINFNVPKLVNGIKRLIR